MFLKIQNDGVANVDAFTVLGLSTARGNSSAIGQFGSGNKLGIVLLLRNMIVPLIYLGNKLLQFGTIDSKMGDKAYKRVQYTFDGQTENTGFCLDYGGLDWDNVDMALREFVSNAIDAGGAIVDLVDKCVPEYGKTTIFVPINDMVAKFYNTLDKRFLCFDKQRKNVIGLLDKRDESCASIYRKGVLVRDINAKQQSLFDYNFGDELKIDESRNLNDTSVQVACSRKLGESYTGLVKLFESVLNRKNTWEENIYHDVPTRSARENIINAWNSVTGGAAYTSSVEAYNYCLQHKQKAVLVNSTISTWFYWIDGMKKAEAMLTEVQKAGGVPVPVSASMQRTFDSVWNKFVSVDMYNNLPKPKLEAFHYVSKGGEVKGGEYDPKTKTVFINIDRATAKDVHIEELIHYTTGAADFTREFQMAAMKFAARCMSYRK